MKNLLTDIPFGGTKVTNGITGFGTIGGNSGEGNAVGVFVRFLSTMIGFLSIIAAIWFVIQIIVAAVGIIAGAGDKNNMENGRVKITQSVIGLIVVVSGLFIVNLVGDIFGVQFLNINGLILNIKN